LNQMLQAGDRAAELDSLVYRGLLAAAMSHVPEFCAFSLKRVRSAVTIEFGDACARMPCCCVQVYTHGLHTSASAVFAMKPDQHTH
jgi:hypothetical protein